MTSRCKRFGKHVSLNYISNKHTCSKQIFLKRSCSANINNSFRRKSFNQFIRKYTGSKLVTEVDGANFTLTARGGTTGNALQAYKGTIDNIVNLPRQFTNGDIIKIIIGSPIISEGITLKNVREVHILDAFFKIS